MIINLFYIKSEVSSMDVLIIDDEKNIRQLLKEIFELNQYHVDTAENGQEGINKFLENEYKLIFIDKRMPGISGEKVLFKIRETKDRKSTRLNSSHVSISYAVFCLKKKKKKKRQKI